MAQELQRVELDDGELSLLSPREAEVLSMTSRGLTNAQVAESLRVTVHAVKFHLASIYRKLGVANRTEAAVWLFEHRQNTP
jgi:DNA-binding CsgD family transcriptional regulator